MEMITPDKCPKCGSPLEMYYNAGQPVWGCVHCQHRQRLEYSDHTSEYEEADGGYYYYYYETR